jgi:hypothetical protein
LAASALRGDRFIFTTGPHREISDIYNQRWPEFGLTNPEAHLISLDEQCHPPNECSCWVLVDRAHTSAANKKLAAGIDRELRYFPRTRPRKIL